MDIVERVHTDRLPPVAAAPATPRRALLLRGITWSAAYQVLEVVLSFGAMLVLVRIIAVGDYGRAAAVGGVLAFLNLFSAHVFFEHALQLPDGRDPDWDRHWTWGFYIQSALAIVGHGLAGLCWLSPDYRPIAPLVHVAAVGVLLEWPSHFGVTMLRRALDLRRIRIVAAVGMALRLLTTLALALSGFGAYAIVIGGNVVPAVPFAVDLLLVRKWRPKPGWWRLPAWQAYAAERRFGLQRTGSSLIGGTRSALEAALLPAPLGFAALGLLSRSQAIYTMSIGRLGAVLNDAIYPFLPRVANHRQRFASYGTTYLQVLSLIAIPGALFVGQQGPLLSRVLYGTKWIAMDPLIWPGALVGLAVAMMSTTSSILMSAGHVRTCMVVDAFVAVAGALALGVAYVSRQAISYSWMLAAGELAAAAIGLWWASQFLERRWWQHAVLPPTAAALGGLAVAHLTESVLTTGTRPLVDLVVMTVMYFFTAFVVVRLFFATALGHLLDVVPGGGRIRALVRLSREAAQ